jgi:hypothetical protein
LIFCCDLHDKKTAETTVYDIEDIEKRKEFIYNMRHNPYIWLCLFFNPCSFGSIYTEFKTKNSVQDLVCQEN